MLCRFTVKNGVRVCSQCGVEIKSQSERIFRECVAPVDSEGCHHRGESLRVEKCRTCQSQGVEVQIYACTIHGECTLHNISKRKPDGSRWQACSTCEQRSP